MKRAPLRTIGLGLKTFDGRRVAPSPKVAEPTYALRNYKQWREAIIARAGARCEAVMDGQRCVKAAPGHRMFADHIEEIRDGGERFALSNGRCLCGSHHTAKTAQARAARRA